MTTVAAGMALEGKTVFTYSIGKFSYFEMPGANPK